MSQVHKPTFTPEQKAELELQIRDARKTLAALQAKKDADLAAGKAGQAEGDELKIENVERLITTIEGHLGGA